MEIFIEVNIFIEIYKDYGWWIFDVMLGGIYLKNLKIYYIDGIKNILDGGLIILC